jgi:hypothetical protein
VFTVDGIWQNRVRVSTTGKGRVAGETGSFSLWEWPGHPTKWSLCWNGVHVHWPTDRPVVDGLKNYETLEAHFLSHVPLLALTEYVGHKQRLAHEEGRAALQQELKELLGISSMGTF